MRKMSLFLIVILTLALSATLVLAAAQPLAEAFAIPWWTAGGGGTSQGGSFTLGGTIGQPAAGSVVGGNYILASGFWNSTQAESRIYLPLIIR